MGLNTTSSDAVDVSSVYWLKHVASQPVAPSPRSPSSAAASKVKTMLEGRYCSTHAS